MRNPLPSTRPHTTPHCVYPPHAQPHVPKRDPIMMEAKNLMRRKRIQLEHAREHDEAVVTLKQKVGVRVCKCAQGRALAWWVQLEHAREHDEAVVTLKQKVRVCGCASVQGRALVWWVQLEHLREHDDAVVMLEQRVCVCVLRCAGV